MAGLARTQVPFRGAECNDLALLQAELGGLGAKRAHVCADCQQRHSESVTAIFTLATAALFVPMHAVEQPGSDRRCFRSQGQRRPGAVGL